MTKLVAMRRNKIYIILSNNVIINIIIPIVKLDIYKRFGKSVEFKKYLHGVYM